MESQMLVPAAPTRSRQRRQQDRGVRRLDGLRPHSTKGGGSVMGTAPPVTGARGSIVVFPEPPRDWLTAGILTPHTPLQIERAHGGLATVRRVDGRPFSFTHGTIHRTRIPLVLLLLV